MTDLQNPKIPDSGSLRTVLEGLPRGYPFLNRYARNYHFSKRLQGMISLFEWANLEPFGL